jgi:3-hydroxyisobutyrate dehydrogenase-like beta-hydroxyacid dehydrogenase
MEQNVGLIGFGEAGSTFARAGGWARQAHVFDAKTRNVGTRSEMFAAYARAGVVAGESLEDALDDVSLVLSLVTADQALDVAKASAMFIVPGAIYCDMNSVAPQTKQAAARAIEAAGGHYIDAALMAPVNPAQMRVPLLLSGRRAQTAGERLKALGFADVRVAGADIGKASSVKMIRSVLIKGIEALTVECLFAAEAAKVRDEVLASLDASERCNSWERRADYCLDRMLVHGLRRAAEMEEVIKTLDALGTGSTMTRGTLARQRALGGLRLRDPLPGLENKLRQVNERKVQAA